LHLWLESIEKYSNKVTFTLAQFLFCKF